MQPDVEQFRELPIADKLRLVEQLWDEIADSSEPFPLPDWHRTESRRRAAELEADPSMAISREELWRRVDNSRE